MKNMSSGLEVARTLWTQLVVVIGVIVSILIGLLPDDVLKLVSSSDESRAGVVSSKRDGATSPITLALLQLVSWSDESRAGLVKRDGATSPITRALHQLLELMNEIPVSSRKYKFTRELAEKLIVENVADGLLEVNKVALEAGFARTLQLLTFSLDESVQGHALARLLRRLPLLELPVFQFVMKALTSQTTDESKAQKSKTEAEEKLSQELLWIAQKLNECSTAEGVVHQWSSASRLSVVAPLASSGAQNVLITLSAFMFEELTTRLSGVGDNMKVKLLSLWMPLFCKVTSGTSQSLEIESNMKRLISSLNHGNREAVLSIWLREFSTSSSDWPDFRECYTTWCQESRKI